MPLFDLNPFHYTFAMENALTPVCC